MSSTARLELLHEIADALDNDGTLTVGTMFRSPGIRIGNKIVAFLGHDDQLIVKLPRTRAVSLMDSGDALPVTMGTRTMREWVAVPGAGDDGSTLAKWLPLAKEALAYVKELETPEPDNG